MPCACTFPLKLSTKFTSGNTDGNGLHLANEDEQTRWRPTVIADLRVVTAHGVLGIDLFRKGSITILGSSSDYSCLASRIPFHRHHIKNMGDSDSKTPNPARSIEVRSTDAGDRPAISDDRSSNLSIS